ncbi:hypothetical protein [Halomicrococcus sp. SG-WS-1]|uniref:hypothetical protein n=1 Tax=Halomicrococcus sp. SG-WS-1 TaxID=3439057 RepID=UPI003F78E34B
MAKNSHNPSRRKALKSIGAGAVGLTSLPITTGAKSDVQCRSVSNTKFTGLAYDPESLEIVGNASGEFSEIKKGLSGNISVPSTSVSLSRSQPETPRRNSSSESRLFTKNERKEEKNPYKHTEVVVTSDNSITGNIRKPSLDSVAFTLLPKSAPKANQLEEFIKRAKPDRNRTYEQEVTEQSGSIASTDDENYKDITWVRTRDYGNDFDDDGWEWFAYLTGDADKSYDVDQLPNNGYNRWSLQSYFTKVPSSDTSDVSLDLTSHTDYIDVAPDSGYKSGRDSGLKITSERPDTRGEDDDYSFSVGIGYAFGSVSVGPSLSVNLDRNTYDLNDDHMYSEWIMNLNQFPTGQEDNRGVWFDMEPSTSEDTKEVRAESQYNWNYDEAGTACDPGRTIYVRDSVDLPLTSNLTVDIV